MIGKLEDEARRLEAELALARRVRRQLQTDSKIRERYLARMTQLPTDAMRMEDSLRQELTQLKKKNEILEKAIAKSQEQQASLNAEEAALKDKLANLPSTDMDMMQGPQVIKQLSVASDRHSAALAMKIVKLDECIQVSSEHRMRLLDQLRRLRRESADKIRQMQSSIGSAANRRDALKSECESLERQIGRLRSSIPKGNLRLDRRVQSTTASSLNSACDVPNLPNSRGLDMSRSTPPYGGANSRNSTRPLRVVETPVGVHTPGLEVKRTASIGPGALSMANSLLDHSKPSNMLDGSGHFVRAKPAASDMGSVRTGSESSQRSRLSHRVGMGVTPKGAGVTLGLSYLESPVLSFGTDKLGSRERQHKQSDERTADVKAQSTELITRPRSKNEAGDAASMHTPESIANEAVYRATSIDQLGLHHDVGAAHADHQKTIAPHASALDQTDSTREKQHVNASDGSKIAILPDHTAHNS